MPPIHLVVASAEEAADGNAEFWCGPELIEPWLIDTETLALALEDAANQIATY